MCAAGGARCENRQRRKLLELDALDALDALRPSGAAPSTLTQLALRTANHVDDAILIACVANSFII